MTGVQTCALPISLTDLLMGIVIPDKRNNMFYRLTNDVCLSLLSVELIGKETTDKGDWLSYLRSELVNFDEFSKKLQKAANKVYNQQFLSLGERKKKLNKKANRDRKSVE